MSTNSENYYLYRHIRLDTNEVFYIGIGKSEFRYKSYEMFHKRAFTSKNRSEWWKRVVAKTPYKVEILFSTSNLEEIKEKEIEFIKLYGRRDLGLGTLVNLTDGGDGLLNIIYTEERRQKVSKANKGKKRTQETKNKLSEIKKKDTEGIEKLKERSKKPKSEETKKKISESVKRYFDTPGARDKASVAKSNISEETRTKISIAKKNISQETRDKMSNSKKGKPWTQNQKEAFKKSLVNPKIKQKRSEAQKKKVINTDTGKIYNGIMDCAKDLNVPASTLGKHLRGYTNFNKFPNFKLVN